MGTLEDQIWVRLSEAWATWILLIIILLVYVFAAGVEGFIWGPSQENLLRWGALNASKIDEGEVWRLSSSLMLHGGILHVGLNSLALVALGRMAEAGFGTISTLSIVYISGLGGAFLSWSMGSLNTVGLSGGLFGLLAALSVFGWKYRAKLPGELGNTLRKKLGFLGLLNLFIGLWIPMIDNPSHFGGYAVGTVLGLCLGHYGEKEKRFEEVFLGLVSLLGILITVYSYF
ncbi:MAG: rhomboid family intramembrane serine protease [Myxococcota bacterium]|nr:rhomboid family intramembrane serine protease [Myxococcota bacterium]